MRASKVAVGLAVGLGLVAALAQAKDEKPIPAHPREIQYPPMKFEVPKRADHRAVLSNGLRVYLVADRTVPTLHARAWIATGEIHAPKEKKGLAKLCGDLLRTGGIEGLDARALDAKLDELAATIDVDVNRETSEASLWTLSKHADEALSLFAKVLTRPVFEADRIRRSKDEMLSDVAHRDDDPQAQLDHEAFQVLFGEEHPLALRESEASIGAIAREDLVAFHRRWIVPARTVLAVAGDFDPAAMKAKLESLLGTWKGEPVGPEAAAEEAPRGPGVYILDRELNQGFVDIVTPSVRLGHPDEIALQVMNYILGGGSFTSRITARVRNDEGLAYSAGSYVHAGRNFPGVAGLYFQSKAETAAYAARICLDELRKIREDLVAPDELERAKASLRDRFPERFATAPGAAETLARAEFDGRPEDYLATYPARVDAITAEDVRRAARAHLDPAKMSIVVVGPRAAVTARDAEHGIAIEELGKVHDLVAD